MCLLIKKLVVVKAKDDALEKVFDKHKFLFDAARCSNCPFGDSCSNLKVKGADYGCDERKEGLVRWMRLAKAKDFGEILATERLLADAYVEYELAHKFDVSKGKLFNRDTMYQRRTILDHLERLHLMKYGSKVAVQKSGSYADVQAKIIDAEVKDG